MVEQDLMNALDEELEKCIKKLRNAVYGYEVRTFITEYEELMLKKSDVVVKEFLNKENRKENRAIWRIPIKLTTVYEKKQNYLMILQIAEGLAIILLALSVIMR
nr:hypothetical protein [uncultured Sellimonas sp.]